MMQAEWLPLLMQGCFDEIYVMDCKTLRFLQANSAACANLQYSLAEMQQMSLPDILDAESQSTLLQQARSPNSDLNVPLVLHTHMQRRNKTCYPVELRLLSCHSSSPPALIAIGKDVSTQQETAQELGVSKSLFSAIVSNTPGLVYQFQSGTDDKVSFSYLSEGCQALLGVSPEQLCAEPERFLDLVLPEDRASYMDSMRASSQEMKAWNWEGRIWIDAWKDIKWINLRATPHLLSDERVQWNGIMTNITQSKLEQFEIKRSRARLAELSAHIERVKELEQTRIAREVHDDLGGNLTAIKMALARLSSRLPDDNDDLAEMAAYVNSVVDRTIESAHRIASDLRPGVLDFGIVAALEWQTDEFEKQVGMPCTFESSAKEIKLTPEQATGVFRIFQEALTNIAKHARATRVAVKLSLSRGHVNLEIIDNGKGIEAAERMKPQSFGMRGMIERAHSLGGKLTISQTEGGGNTIAVKIPQKSAPEK